ncbi:MAG TPA: hypothetical protein VJ044_12145 [Candidatus Hodarchaeales archaeon]|nr:hypothetical protein [Candidatus Hodarchaeales archaeon]
MSSSSESEKLLAELSRNPQFRTRFREALGIDNDPVRKTDFAPFLDELIYLRKDLNTRFIKRFEANDKRHEEMQSDFIKRFEANDKHHEEMRTDFIERFEANDAKFRELLDAFTLVRRDVASISTKQGYRLEDTFRQLYHEALVQQNIDPESIRKLDILDEQGDVVEPGGVTDIDIFARDSECAAIEIKATIDQHDIRRFEKTIKLAEEQEGIKVTRRVIVTLNIRPENRIRAQKKGFIVISSEL